MEGSKAGSLGTESTARSLGSEADSGGDGGELGALAVSADSAAAEPRDAGAHSFAAPRRDTCGTAVKAGAIAGDALLAVSPDEAP